MNNFWKTLDNTIITPNRATFHDIDYPPSSCEDDVTPRIHMGPQFEFSENIKCGLTKVFDEEDEYTRLLRRCEGHCKTDADCEDGLVCGLDVEVFYAFGQRMVSFIFIFQTSTILIETDFEIRFLSL